MSDLEQEREDEVQIPCEEVNAETINNVTTNVASFEELNNMKFCELKKLKKRNLKLGRKKMICCKDLRCQSKTTHPLLHQALTIQQQWCPQ